MVFTGKIIKNNKIIKEVSVLNNEEIKIHFALEKSLIETCKKLNIAVPIWLSKNTTEFTRYKKTSFDNEQFYENIDFDRFEIIVVL